MHIIYPILDLNIAQTLISLFHILLIFVQMENFKVYS
jgi:hypothetical protein